MLDFRMHLDKVFLLQRRVEEKDTAGNAGALGQQLIRPRRSFQSIEIKGRLTGSENSTPVSSFHVELLTTGCAKIQRTFGTTKQLQKGRGRESGYASLILFRPRVIRRTVWIEKGGAVRDQRNR